MLEGHRFCIFTDQKPLTSAFFKAREPVSNRQRQQFAFISEFTNDIAHVPGLENVVADALTRQFDDERASSIVNAISHSLADIDLAELASEQPPISEVQAPSLDLKAVQFSGIDQPVVCDTLQGQPRVLVLETYRWRIFDAEKRLTMRS